MDMRDKNPPNSVIGGVKGTSFFKIHKHKKEIKDNCILQTIRTLKEVSLSASMTLEASIALPLFIFFFVNIIAAIDIVRVQSEMEATLHQVGSDACLLAFDMREGENLVEPESDALRIMETGGLNGYVYYQLKKCLDPKLASTAVTDRINISNMLSSKIMVGNDIVDIVIDYKVHPIISLIGFRSFLVESRYYGHAWTGYDITGSDAEDSQTEEMVYVTEHGSVYHRDIGCKYLKPSIKSVSYSQLANERNKDQSKYYPCEYCGQGVAGGNVFITDYGERYHSTIDCPGIKRKIYTIPISEVGGKSPCSGCG
jgi:hypothetical protein